jgi:hypothetical protein
MIKIIKKAIETVVKILPIEIFSIFGNIGGIGLIIVAFSIS